MGLGIFPRRRPARVSNDERGERGAKGASERDLSVIDRSMRPIMAMNEQTVLASRNRAMEIAEWREMTSERKWQTLGIMGFAFWKKEPTTEVGDGEVVAKQVAPKAPHQKAPTTYCGDQKEEKGAEKGKGKDSKGTDPNKKGWQRKGRQRKRYQRKGGKRKSCQRRKELREGWGIPRSCKE